jgi:N-acetylglucosaminyldiphosphoundecaprenol N-acetyl-beta-D-mannosaminyltransferase
MGEMRNRNPGGFNKFMKKEVLGIKIDDISFNEALAIVEHWIWNPGRHYIVTPNPEFIVAAQTDSEFKKILNQADMAIPDGVGLKLGGDIENTISGVDFMEGLIKMAAEKGFVTGFLGGRDRVAEKCAECLQKKHPKLKVAFATGNIDDKILPTDLLFVALGHVKQEKWIANNLDKIPVKVAMGVGGAFDYLSGNIPRAPVWMRNLGMEWLFRLLVQPWRIKRQLALFKYLWLLLKYD